LTIKRSTLYLLFLQSKKLDASSRCCISKEITELPQIEQIPLHLRDKISFALLEVVCLFFSSKYQDIVDPDE
jgi:hypothetical protein